LEAKQVDPHLSIAVEGHRLRQDRRREFNWIRDYAICQAKDQIRGRRRIGLQKPPPGLEVYMERGSWVDEVA
jgi:hypothetical protein